MMCMRCGCCVPNILFIVCPFFPTKGRGSQFKSKEDRDKWIQTELKSLAKQIKDKITHQNKLQDDSKRDAAKQAELEKKIEEHMAEVESMRTQIDQFYKESYEKKKEKDALQTQRKYVRIC